MKEKIDFDTFMNVLKTVEIKVGRILDIKDVPGSKNMICLEVDFGNSDYRSVLTNLKHMSNSDYYIGASALFVTNLIPRTMFGIESTAMIFGVDNKEVMEVTNVDIGFDIMS